MCKVVNIATQKCDVYIGRSTPNPTIFANPFKSGRDGTRSEVIEKFRVYLNELLKDPKNVDALMALKGKTIGCHCKPLSCHGDVIVEEIERRSNDLLWQLFK